MAKVVQPRKHRHKRHYTFTIVSSDSDRSSKQFHLGPRATQVVAFILFAVLVFVVCYIAYISIRYSQLKHDVRDQAALISQQAATIDSLSSINSSVIAEREELSAKVDQISKALNIMVEDQEASEAAQVEAAMPKGFPLTSQATYESALDDPSSKDKVSTDQGNAIIIFNIGEGSQVVAAGSGTVHSVTSDSKYGKCITIDHGNGYQSIYRSSGTVLIEEGDTVARGDVILIAGKGTAVLGYQIQYNDEYVNPEDMIEING